MATYELSDDQWAIVVFSVRERLDDLRMRLHNAKAMGDSVEELQDITWQIEQTAAALEKLNA